MDVAEGETDIKLYKASAELLSELRAKIPRLVTDPSGKTFRKWIQAAKCLEVTRTLDAFQDWPQLLDPHLSSLVQVLVDGYLFYCVSCPSEYIKEHDLQNEIWPLPRAVARVLYTLCKVRGQKIIIRLLNNEPKYIEPLASCFRLWTVQNDTRLNIRQTLPMTWEERYIHLLWLSHLMLAPFELSTISGLSMNVEGASVPADVCVGLPAVAVNLIMIAFDHLAVSSKAREAACIVLVRLALRNDMQKLVLANRLINWTISEVRLSQPQEYSSLYRQIGLLSLTFGITNLASISETCSFLGSVFSLAHEVTTSPLQHFKAIRDSAPARKLLIKIMRSTIVKGIVAVDTHPNSDLNFDINDMLDQGIQALLEALADNDTPIRQAASKALSQICMNLQEQMSSEVVEAVLDNLNENMLLEDIETGKLFPVTDVPKSASHKYKKNMNAVNPLKWHGCILTLGHLLFRRALPLSQLSGIIQVLLMGLEFEQRSNVGTTVGVSVRDAACFGIWSLARKYSTSELNDISVGTALISEKHLSIPGVDPTSTLQLIATHLAVSACLDPSGNLRRGSSAALQELIGRHPDAITEGISVVQTIDYTAVARRSRATTEIAVAASKLHSTYHTALLYAMLGWRGAKATDADSRRQAAHAVAFLVSMATQAGALSVLNGVVLQLKQLRLANTGSNASSRHGLLCCLSAILATLERSKAEQGGTRILEAVMPIIRDIESYIGTIDGRITADIEYVFEGISKTIGTSARVLKVAETIGKGGISPEALNSWLAAMTPILRRCTVASDKDFVSTPAARANIAMWDLLKPASQTTLFTSWVDPSGQSKADFTSKGHITTLGHLYSKLESNSQSEEHKGLTQQIADHLTTIVISSYPIETKVNAMQSIKGIFENCPELSSESVNLLLTAINSGLMNYMIDQRGDIGSLVRLESVDTVRHLSDRSLKNDEIQQTQGLLVKLASEKLVKVRFQAWTCLQLFLESESVATKSFQHQADVSSYEYFRNLLELMKQPQYREQLLLGLVTSMTGGTEEVTRACGQALITCIQDQEAVLRRELIDFMFEFTARFVSTIAGADDREVLPVLDFLAFLVEHFLADLRDLSSNIQLDRIWSACQKSHLTSSSITRIEAMIRLYSALALTEYSRKASFDKLTRLLLHRWPKVRSAAADAIYIHTVPQSIVMCDWNLPVTENKPIVVALRKELNVAGSAANA